MNRPYYGKEQILPRVFGVAVLTVLPPTAVFTTHRCVLLSRCFCLYLVSYQQLFLRPCSPRTAGRAYLSFIRNNHTW